MYPTLVQHCPVSPLSLNHSTAAYSPPNAATANAGFASSTVASPTTTTLSVPEPVNPWFGLGRTLRNWADQARWPGAVASAATRLGQAVGSALGQIGASLPAIGLPGAQAHAMPAADAPRQADNPAVAAFDALRNVVITPPSENAPGQIKARRDAGAATRQAMRAAVQGLASEGPRMTEGLTRLLSRHDGLIVLGEPLQMKDGVDITTDVTNREHNFMMVRQGAIDGIELQLAGVVAADKSAHDSPAVQRAVGHCVDQLQTLSRLAEQCVGLSNHPDCARPLALAQHAKARRWPLALCTPEQAAAAARPGDQLMLTWEIMPRLNQANVARRLVTLVDRHCKVTFGNIMNRRTVAQYLPVLRDTAEQIAAAFQAANEPA